MMMNGDDGACWRGGVVRVGNEGDVDNCARRERALRPSPWEREGAVRCGGWQATYQEQRRPSGIGWILLEN